jgi:protein TonB
MHYHSAMRKSKFLKHFSGCICALGILALLQFAGTVRAQVAAPAAQPTDANQLMLLAAKANGITGDGMQPWHLKASYTILDENGTPKDQGTFEEMWASPTSFKRTFAGQNYSRSEFGTEKGVVFTGRGAQETPRAQILEMEREFASPVPDTAGAANLQFEAKPLDLGTMHLSCLQASFYASSLPDGVWGHSFCIGADKLALRISSNGYAHTQYIHNHLVSFQGRFVAGDLLQKHDGKSVFAAHLESIEPLAATESGLLQAPANAKPMEITAIQVSGSLAAGMLLKGTAPDYPPIAKAARVSGTVVLQALIGKDGLLKELRVASGPAMLQQAAMDAVKQWVYRPYLLGGNPVEVQTTINVNFNLGQPPPRF